MWGFKRQCGCRRRTWGNNCGCGGFGFRHNTGVNNRGNSFAGCGFSACQSGCNRRCGCNNNGCW